MDELVNGRLREQERALRGVIAVFARLSQREGGLGSGPDWFGPAAAAYDITLGLLRMELRAARSQLDDALHDTVNAIVTFTGPEDSCGG